MKKQLFYLSFALLFGCISSLKAQISDVDKRKIINIFKDVDPNSYRLVFNDASEVHGQKPVQMNDLKRLSRSTGSASAKGIKWTFIVGDRSANEVFYVYTEGESELMSMLGQQKYKALQDIVMKYGDIMIK
jgi:hypothetical protein